MEEPNAGGAEIPRQCGDFELKKEHKSKFIKGDLVIVVKPPVDLGPLEGDLYCDVGKIGKITHSPTFYDRRYKTFWYQIDKCLWVYDEKSIVLANSELAKVLFEC